jgi:hypothetical protein|tara:strand:+ start:2726 stop:3961 length:1236 start_codon:yes stop_codon:yes gene_type:complete
MLIEDIIRLQEAEGKNTHMEHVEEEALNRGKEGAEYAINQMMLFADMLKGRTNKKLRVSVKWDGAPAIICGVDPESKKFFVGTKGVFNASPKLGTSHEEIDRLYGESGAVSKLHLAYDYLSKLGITGVLQGDFMFDDSSRREEEIDGEKMYTFKPQLITYAVPVDSDIGKRIGSAKFGIVFHTNYEGNTLADATANYDVNVSNLKRSNDVWFDDAFFKDVSGSVLMTKDETAQVKKDLADAMGAYKAVPNAVWEAMKSNDDFIKNFKIWINTNIRQGKLAGDPGEFLNGFIDWYKERIEGEIAKLKNQDPEKPAVKNRLQKIENNMNFINTNRKGLSGIIIFMTEITNLKKIFITKLNNIESIAHFYKTADGYEAGSPEGYVAIDHTGGAVKIVDRLEFSRRNFTTPKDFG